MSKLRLSARHRARELHRRQAHDRHALDVLDRRVGREQLVEVRHDRQVHVGPAHLAHELERLLVRRLGEGEHDPVDVVPVDELGEVGGARRGRRRPARRRRSRPAPARTRGASRSCARAGGRSRRRRRSACGAGRITFGNSHVRTTPRSVGTSTIARPRKMNASTRRVDEDVEALLQALADHEQRQRAGEQRVEERRHLVEALARDRPRLALVEPVDAEDRRATPASSPARAAPAASPAR